MANELKISYELFDGEVCGLENTLKGLGCQCLCSMNRNSHARPESLAIKTMEVDVAPGLVKDSKPCFA